MGLSGDPAPGQPVGEVVTGWSPPPVPSAPTLVGRHVVARLLGVEHAPDLFAAVCGPGREGLWTYRPGPVPQDLTELEEHLRELQARPDGPTYALLRDGTAQGLVGLRPCVPAHGVAEVSGVLLGPDLQRTRAATEALHLVLGHLVDDLGYRRVEWKCDHLNEPSRRAALRLGFVAEGTFRQHMVVHGRSRDTDWFSIVDGEWPAVRARHRRWLDGANFDDDGRQRSRLADC